MPQTRLAPGPQTPITIANRVDTKGGGESSNLVFVSEARRGWADGNLPRHKFTSYKYKTLHTQYGELLVKSLSLCFIPKYKQIHCRLSRSYGTKKRVHIELTYRHILRGDSRPVTLHLSLLDRRYPGGPGRWRG